MRSKFVPEWLTYEVEQALAAIGGEHVTKKEATVLRMAQAIAAGETAHDVAMRETLWSFVRLVSKEECRCGNPPYDNGNPCNACYALELLELRQHDRHKST